MSDSKYNPNDPAFLASRALDESLPVTAKAKLDEATQDVSSLGAKMEAVDRLVKKWGRPCPDIDWATYEKLVTARVESIGDEERLESVEGMLAKWAEAPPFDEHRFESEVMNRIRGKRPKRLRRILFRIAAPLAAAAAIGIVATGILWPRQPNRPTVLVEIGPVATPDAASTAVAFVIFDRTPRFRNITDSRPVLSFLAVGSSESGRAMEESPPI